MVWVRGFEPPASSSQSLPSTIDLHPDIATTQSICSDVVRVARLELARYLYRGILSPLCLPIPPYPHINGQFSEMPSSASTQNSVYFTLSLFVQALLPFSLVVILRSLNLKPKPLLKDFVKLCGLRLIIISALLKLLSPLYNFNI